MKFEAEQTVLKPFEAQYIKYLCSLKDDPTALAVYDMTRQAMFEWALAVSPTIDFSIADPDTLYPYAISVALFAHGREAAEVVAVSYNTAQLHRIRGMTAQNVAIILDRAGIFGSDEELRRQADMVNAGIIKDSQTITDDQLETLKARIFDMDLQRLATGQSLLADFKQQ